MSRTCYTGDVSLTHLDQTVTLYGWCHRRRDHGGVIFIDLRDREGLAQIVFDPDNQQAFAIAEGIRNEYCLKIVGLVRKRPEGTTNDQLKSGQVEVLCREVEVLNASVTPPFQLDDDNLSETIRLTHRVIDLRRPVMQHNLKLRYRVCIEARKYLDELGFIDIETPMLTRSTPEGARDYLVPSRVHDGQFFALPQSPQLFKQMLMVAGFDRYYQITKCFRDEDLRADRQPEFTQIDCETSFLTEGEIRDIFEGMMRHLFKIVKGVDLPNPFPTMSWADAMTRFGSDKPDLRVQLAFTELTDVMKTVDFKVFQAAAQQPGGRVVALRVPGGAAFSRKEIDDYTQFVGIYGAKGLAWIKVNSLAQGRDGLQSPIVKNLHDDAIAAILSRSGAQDGDILFFGADKAKVVNDAMGNLRVKIGHSDFAKANGLFTPGWQPLWVVDFPMFEWSEEEGRLMAMHHPFTHPKEEDIPLLDTNPAAVRADAYDMVINGVEVGGGSIRIHEANLQAKMFEILGFTPEKAQAQFGFLMNAFKYGAPPHGGLAYGLDRWVSLFAGLDSIRDCIAFPKNNSGRDVMLDAPSEIDPSQLEELNLVVDLKEEK